LVKTPRVLWAIIALAVVGFAWSWYRAGSARTEALVERGRAEEMARQRTVAERDAADARRQATAHADSVVLARREAGRVAEEARQKALEARQTATGVATRLRVALDSLGASTALLDSLEIAHQDEVSAVREELGAVSWERDVLTRYAESMEVALRTADSVADLLRLERDSYRRQADLLLEGIQVPWQAKAYAGVAMVGVLALVVLAR
jgi:hypothetical protein